MSTPPPAGQLDLLLIAPSEAEFCTFPVSTAEFDLEANRIVGSVRNGGQVIGADVRSPSFRQGTPVLNRQSVSVISDADLDHIVGGFEGSGAITDFLALPADVDFGPYDTERRRFTDAAVVITRVNEPCTSPAQLVGNYYPRPISKLGKRFVQVAQGRRGYVGMVAKGGAMARGQLLGFVPFGGR